MKPSSTTASRSPAVLFLAAAAAAAVPLVSWSAGVAHAQYPVENGRANDASNLIGSGGYNAGPIPAPETVTGNQIVTGNVTGGRSFRGPVGYNSPNTFFGPSATADYDRFIRDSTGAPVSYNRNQTNFSNNAVPFYNTVSAPPPGFAASPNNRVFVPAPTAGVTKYQGPRLDERFGVITDAPEDALPQPGQLLIPGPVDASANPTFISASPLTGVRTFSANDPTAAAIFNTQSALTSNGRPLLTDDQILRMRRELSQSLATPDLAAPGAVTPLPTQGTAVAPTGPQARSLTAPPPTPFEAPENRSLSPQPLSGNAFATTANDLSTGQGSFDRLASPSQQSSQYAEMRRRLDRYNTQQQPPKSAEQLNQEFRTQLQQQQQQQQQPGTTPQRPGQPANQQQQQGGRDLTGEDLGQRARDIAAGRTPAGGNARQPKGESPTYVHNPTGGVTAVVPTLPNERPAVEPVEVHSLATGVKAEGLRTLLEKAESLMRDGKFDSAIAQYESAAQVAPNNPMILLGQANAELGGEYFARAENHLRQSFLLDPTLLMARYDLRAMIGDQRLNDVIGGLKQIAAKETNQPQAAFLLAYIAYNTHDSGRAASYLNLAEHRAAAPDPVFRLLRTHWNLPAKSAPAATPTSTPANLNK